MANLQEVSKVMAVMALAYPRFELTAGMIKVYAGLLSDMPQDVLEAAGKQLMVESTFFPSLAEWRNKAHDIMSGVHSLPSAGDAWEEAITHCRNGKYTDYSHPLIQRAVDVIGIPYWRTMEVNDEMATRAHFFKVYESLLNRAAEDMRLLPEARAVSDKYALGVGNLVKKLEAK